MKLYVSTDPFSSTSAEPENKLKYSGFDYRFNRYGRKLTSDELAEDIGDVDVLIAGTEKVTRKVFEAAPNLRLISRVGIGLDGIDFDLCKEYGVQVAFTPDAPTIAVAELTVGLIIDLVRKISETSQQLKSSEAKWHRHMGMLLNGKTVGLFGMGRIGKSVIHMLSSFNVKFLVNDIQPDIAFAKLHNIKLVTKTDLLKFSDVVSLHIPLNSETIGFISKKDLELMKPEAFIINTARGGVIDEDALYDALSSHVITGAAIDVFEVEPYKGNLREFDNVILTCHMGASTIDSRTEMEIQAVEEAIRFKVGVPLKNEVFSN